MGFKHFILLLVSITVFSSIKGQNRVTNNSTTLVSYWTLNEEKVYTIEQIKKTYDRDKLKDTEHYSSDVHIKIVSETEKSYVIEWTYKNVQSPDAESPFDAELHKMSEGMKIKFRTDETGVFKSLLNWEEIRDFINVTADRLIVEIGKEAYLIDIINQTRNVFQNKENIEALVLEDIQIFHYAFGLKYNLDEQIHYETELLNVFGGDNFPAIQIVELTEINEENNFCKIEMNQEVDKEKGRQIMQEMTSQISNELIKISNFELKNKLDFNFELTTGWPIKAVSFRSISSADTKVIETLQIDLKQ